MEPASSFCVQPKESTIIVKQIRSTSYISFCNALYHECILLMQFLLIFKVLDHFRDKPFVDFVGGCIDARPIVRVFYVYVHRWRGWLDATIFAFRQGLTDCRYIQSISHAGNIIVSLDHIQSSINKDRSSLFTFPHLLQLLFRIQSVSQSSRIRLISLWHLYLQVHVWIPTHKSLK